MKHNILTLILVAWSMQSIGQIRGHVINLNGQRHKDLARIFDGNLETNFNANNVDEPLAFPYESYLVLDSISNLTSLDYYTGNSSQTQGFTVRFLDLNRKEVGSYVTTPTVGKYRSWTRVAIPRGGVRLVQFTALDRGVQWDGINEIRIYGIGIALAPSIYPVKSNYSPIELGQYAHGVNILGDRINKVYGPDTVLLKVARAARFYWVGSDFDYYPQTYQLPLGDGPLWLGRYGSNHSGNLLSTFKRWGIRPMMTKSGGSIKYMDPATASNNGKYLGTSSAQVKKYLEPGADPEAATSWRGLAEQYGQLVQLYGQRKGATRAMGGDTTTGQGSMDIFEWDNEPSRWWHVDYYHSPRAYYQALKAVYHRAKQSDPGAPVYAGALPGIDTIYWKAVYFAHYLEAGLAPFPADGFNFNMYLNDGGAQQSGSRGLSPEQFKIRGVLFALQDFMLRHFGKAVQWTEFGYATDDVSEYDVDAIGTKTDRQVQADWTLRLKAVAQSVPFLQRLYYYAFFEDGTGPFNSMGLFKDTVYKNPDGSDNWKNVVPRPVAFALAQELQIERGAPWFSEVVKDGGDTGVWVTRKGDLLKIWKGSSNGSTASYTLPTESRIYTTNYTRWAPDSTLAKTITVTEGMTWARTVAEPPVPDCNCKTIKAIIKTEYRDSATNKLIRTATATIYLR
jgi:hypothetical protein